MPQITKKVLEDSSSSEEPDELASQFRNPDTFAREMIQLEIDTEAPDVSMETVQKLMALYSEAINYHVSVQSDKYTYFKKKMSQLLLQPQVIEAMEAAHRGKVLENNIKRRGSETSSTDPNMLAAGLDPSLNKSGVEQLAKPDIKKVDMEKKRQEFELARSLSNLDKFDKVRELVTKHEISSTKNHVMVQCNLKKQLEDLNSKLMKRKNNCMKDLSTMSGFTTDQNKPINLAKSEIFESSVYGERTLLAELDEYPPIKMTPRIVKCSSHRVLNVNHSKNN